MELQNYENFPTDETLSASDLPDFKGTYFQVTPETLVYCAWESPATGFMWYVVAYNRTENWFYGFANLGDKDLAEWGIIDVEQLRECFEKIKGVRKLYPMKETFKNGPIMVKDIPFNFELMLAKVIANQSDFNLEIKSTSSEFSSSVSDNDSSNNNDSDTDVKKMPSYPRIVFNLPEELQKHLKNKYGLNEEGKETIHNRMSIKLYAIWLMWQSKVEDENLRKELIEKLKNKTLTRIEASLITLLEGLALALSHTDLVEEILFNEPKLTEEMLNGEFEVGVKLLNGRTAIIKVCPDTTIGEFRGVLRTMENLALKSFRLIYNGKQLEDKNTFGDYGIKADATIQMTAILKGGMRFDPKNLHKDSEPIESYFNTLFTIKRFAFKEK